MAPKKSGKKSGNSTSFKLGEDDRRGDGPPKGQGGRPPNSFKAECERLSYDEVLPKVEKFLKDKDPSNQAWRWAADYVSRYAGHEESGIAGLEIKVVRE